MQPFFIKWLLSYYTGKEDITIQRAYLYAGGIVLCSAISTLTVPAYSMGVLHTGMKIRVGLCSLIYRKSLKLSATALGETTVGQTVNLLSNDVSRFDMVAACFHYLLLGPAQTIVITYIMWKIVGVAALIGVASILMFIPLQAFLGKMASKLRMKTALRTDKRVRLTNEILTGIQAIKMYTWERPFSHLIEKVRKEEISAIRGMTYIRGTLLSCMSFLTRFALFITILYYVLGMDREISTEAVFTLTALYDILKITMTGNFPQGIYI